MSAEISHATETNERSVCLCAVNKPSVLVCMCVRVWKNPRIHTNFCLSVAPRRVPSRARNARACRVAKVPSEREQSWEVRTREHICHNRRQRNLCGWRVVLAALARTRAERVPTHSHRCRSSASECDGSSVCQVRPTFDTTALRPSHAIGRISAAAAAFRPSPRDCCPAACLDQHTAAPTCRGLAKRTHQKLLVFAMRGYKRAAYLDIDMLVTRNVDALLEQQPFAAVAALPYSTKASTRASLFSSPLSRLLLSWTTSRARHLLQVDSSPGGPHRKGGRAFRAV